MMLKREAGMSSDKSEFGDRNVIAGALLDALESIGASSFVLLKWRDEFQRLGDYRLIGFQQTVAAPTKFHGELNFLCSLKHDV